MKQQTKRQILSFHFRKKSIGVQLILIGLFGLLLPILPGLVLIYYGLKLVYPNALEKIIKRN